MFPYHRFGTKRKKNNDANTSYYARDRAKDRKYSL